MAASRGINLTEQHLRLIFDTFKLLDDDRDGMIDKGQFFTLFRALGQTISDAQLSKIFAAALAEQAKEGARLAASAKAGAPPAGADAKKAAAPQPGELVSFRTFVKSFSEAYQKPIKESVLISAFNVFDPSHSGKLSMTQLHDIVSKRGEPLSKTEIDELMLVASLSNAKQVDYALLAKRLLKGPAGIPTI
ncbi:hypothetical protein Efla_005649 [Eimeria flavescens]